MCWLSAMPINNAGSMQTSAAWLARQGRLQQLRGSASQEWAFRTGAGSTVVSSELSLHQSQTVNLLILLRAPASTQWCRGHTVRYEGGLEKGPAQNPDSETLVKGHLD